MSAISAGRIRLLAPCLRYVPLVQCRAYRTKKHVPSTPTIEPEVDIPVNSMVVKQIRPGRRQKVVRGPAEVRVETAPEGKKRGSPRKAKDQEGQESTQTTPETLVPESPKAHQLLQTTSKYPLSGELAATIKPVRIRLSSNPPSKHSHYRPQIVSPELCDDILAQLAPSLEKHKGCDILDINPGVGLWSSKIHDFLKPRSHILFESEPEQYKTWQQPLLDQPGSTYKLVFPGDISNHTAYDKVFEDGHFPHQQPLARDDARPPGSNNTLLVIGSLAYDPPLAGWGHTSFSRQLVDHFMESAWRRRHIHSCGPVRVLLWTNNEDMTILLPRAMKHAHMKKHIVLRKVSSITEIASPLRAERDSGSGANTRSASYEVEAAAQVAKRGHQLGITVPEHRRDPITGIAEEVLNISKNACIIGFNQANRMLKDSHMRGIPMEGLLSAKTRELLTLQKNLGIDHYAFMEKEKDGRNRSTLALPPDQKHASMLAATVKSQELVAERREQLVNIAEEIYSLECDILAKWKDNPEQTDAVLAKIERLEEEYATQLRTIPRALKNSVLVDIDNRLALRGPFLRLEWDQRMYEPLLIQSDEVWPRSRISLVDLNPTPVPEGQDVEFLEYYRDFVIGLFANLGQSLPDALEQLAPGASEIIDDVPALKDPSQGGRLDMRRFRVRMLTQDMVDGLLKAYLNWPFKPPGSDHPKHFQVLYGRKSDAARIMRL